MTRMPWGETTLCALSGSTSPFPTSEYRYYHTFVKALELTPSFLITHTLNDSEMRWFSVCRLRRSGTEVDRCNYCFYCLYRVNLNSLYGKPAHQQGFIQPQHFQF